MEESEKIHTQNSTNSTEFEIRNKPNQLSNCNKCKLTEYSQ